jgi:heme exporter protein A
MDMVTMRLAGQGLRCIRAGREVFAGLDFAVSAGEVVAVVGTNGAGKTSLLRLIAGLIAPAGGQITLEGGDAELSVAEQAHYLGHRDALKPALTVMENLGFWAEFLGGVATGPAATLEAVGLGHAAQLPAGFLSAGQRRRLSIARLLTVQRPIWLLDEPTSALDAGSQKVFAGLMTAHLAGGGLIMAATHTPLGIAARELRIGSAV